ncbi:uncharacterized protein LOC108472983 [Gossypium arboreum]|uniref:uncharacterized protein LOC108472983 n=1 Tax=Gossypium arboreum TaxID=29729 RepID=UPI000819455E|nr:uncharacterized protein LOC108472983 [Gossypium arboreum]
MVVQSGSPRSRVVDFDLEISSQTPISTKEMRISVVYSRRCGGTGPAVGGYVALDVGVYGGACGCCTVLRVGGCTAPGGCGTKQRLGFLKFGLGIGPIGPSGLWVRDGAD